MSVKQHESICLDSAQDRWWWNDHFLGDQIQDEWAVAGVGAAAVVDQQTGGIVRLTTGATNLDTYRIDWGGIRSLLGTKRVSMEFRLKLSVTSNIYCYAYLLFDNSNRINFYRTAANWRLETINGGAGATFDSGIAPDASYHIFRIECHTHVSNHVHFYIDRIETANSPVTVNLPFDAADYLQPRFYVQTREDLAKSIDIDYVAVRQDR